MLCIWPNTACQSMNVLKMCTSLCYMNVTYPFYPFLIWECGGELDFSYHWFSVCLKRWFFFFYIVAIKGHSSLTPMRDPQGITIKLCLLHSRWDQVRNMEGLEVSVLGILNPCALTTTTHQICRIFRSRRNWRSSRETHETIIISPSTQEILRRTGKERTSKLWWLLEILMTALLSRYVLTYIFVCYSNNLSCS